MFVNWHSVDTRGQWIILSTLHSQLGTIQDMMSCPGHCRPARALMSAFVAAASSGSEYHNYFKQRAVQASHQGLSECPVLASRQQGSRGQEVGRCQFLGRVCPPAISSVSVCEHICINILHFVTSLILRLHTNLIRFVLKQYLRTKKANSDR